MSAQGALAVRSPAAPRRQADTMRRLCGTHSEALCCCARPERDARAAGGAAWWRQALVAPCGVLIQRGFRRRSQLHARQVFRSNGAVAEARGVHPAFKGIIPRLRSGKPLLLLTCQRSTTRSLPWRCLWQLRRVR